MIDRHLLPDEIELLLDGDAGFEVVPLKAHLRQCDHCQREYESASELFEILDQLPRLAPSAVFANRVMAEVRVFEPWHVAALDAVRRRIPSSRPARIFAAGIASFSGLVLTTAIFWVALRSDALVFFTQMFLDQARVAVVDTLSSAVSALLGEPTAAILRAGGLTGVAVTLALLLITAVVATAGLNLVASTSRRRRQ